MVLNGFHIRYIWQLKKWKSWELFWSYQLNSTANPAHLPQNWQCCLAGCSRMAPRILGAENLSYLKSIETHARAFLTLNILSIGTVIGFTLKWCHYISFHLQYCYVFSYWFFYSVVRVRWSEMSFPNLTKELSLGNMTDGAHLIW